MSETWKQYMERMERTYSHLPNYITNVGSSMSSEDVVGSEPLDPKDKIANERPDDEIIDEEDFPDFPDEVEEEDRGDSGTAEVPSGEA